MRFSFNLINFEQAILILVKLKKELREGSAWSSHIAVKKEFRRTGLGSQVRYRIFEELRRRGIRRLYGGTLRSNTASLKLTRSWGSLRLSIFITANSFPSKTGNTHEFESRFKRGAVDIGSTQLMIP